MVVISPSIFDFLLFSIGFLLGLDFIISGLLVLRESKNISKKPRLLGLRVMGYIKRLHGSTSNKLFSKLYSTKGLALQTVFAGILSIIGSLVELINIGARLFLMN